MPVHDWTRVEDGVFHDFHVSWIPEIRKVLNGGILPQGYYAMAEQHAGHSIPDLLTLHGNPEQSLETATAYPETPQSGGTALAVEPPRVQRRQFIEPLSIARRRTLAIRHVSGHRLVALLEIISAANKDRHSHLDVFTTKVVDALDHGVHVLVVDLFPPNKFNPQGIHGVIRQRLDNSEAAYDLPADEPFTLASYAAGAGFEIFLEHLAVGKSLPQMPLFLRPDHYVNVPLQSTYDEAYRGVPAFWRNVIEAR